MSEVAVFRMFAVRIAVLLTLVAGSLAWYFFGQPAGQGLLIGGLAGALVFFFQAKSIEKLAKDGTGSVNSRLSAWSMARLVIYAIVLTRAYYLDQEGFTGLIGAVIGLFIIVIAVLILGATGLDLRPPNEESD
jgi:hypothetical protein